MSMALKTAVIQHALDVSQLYKDNCALTRGLPQALPRLRIADTDQQDAVSTNPPQQPVTQPQANTPATAVPPPAVVGGTQQKPTGWLKPALITAGALLGGAGAGAGAMYFLGPDETNISVEQPGDASLLQYLEDNGMHLPPEKRGVQK